MSGFRGNYRYTLRFVNLDLIVGSFRSTHRFHLLILKNALPYVAWITLDQSPQGHPSIYHQCLKAIRKGRRLHINVVESSFQRLNTLMSSPKEGKLLQPGLKGSSIGIGRPQRQGASASYLRSYLNSSYPTI